MRQILNHNYLIDYINNTTNIFTSSSSLTSLKANRTDELGLTLDYILEIKANIISIKNEMKDVINDISTFETEVQLDNIYKLNINTITPKETIFQSITSNTLITKHTQIDSLELLAIGNSAEPAYTIEYIENFFTYGNDLPNSLETIKHQDTLKIDYDLIIKDTMSDSILNKQALVLTIDNEKVYILKYSDNDSDGQGAIIYKNTPSLEYRDKIRNCLSFFYGRPFIYIGESTCSESWLRISSKIKSIDTLKDFESLKNNTPPCPVFKHDSNIVDNILLSTYINRILLSYDKYNLKVFFERYFHALIARPYIAGIHWASLIEFIQTKKLDELDIPSHIINTKDAAKIRKILQHKINNLYNKDEKLKLQKEHLTNKLHNFNSMSNAAKGKEVFKHLKLELGYSETKSFQNRQNAAHGKDKESDDKNNILLRGITWKLLLAATETTCTFINYYPNQMSNGSIYQKIE